MVLNAGDLLRPGNQAWVRYSGSVLAFGFGKRFECVFQLLLQRGTGHKEGYHSGGFDKPAPADATYGDRLTNEGVSVVLTLLLRDKSELPNHALAITKTAPSKSSCGKNK